MVSERLAHHWANREIEHVVIIHDVKVHPVGTADNTASSSPKRAKSAARMEGAMTGSCISKVHRMKSTVCWEGTSCANRLSSIANLSGVPTSSQSPR